MVISDPTTLEDRLNLYYLVLLFVAALLRSSGRLHNNCDAVIHLPIPAAPPTTTTTTPPTTTTTTTTTTPPLPAAAAAAPAAAAAADP